MKIAKLGQENLINRSTIIFRKHVIWTRFLIVLGDGPKRSRF